MNGLAMPNGDSSAEYVVADAGQCTATRALDRTQAISMEFVRNFLGPHLTDGNACIAGGFARSIMEQSGMNFTDIDVFCFTRRRFRKVCRIVCRFARSRKYLYGAEATGGVASYSGSRLRTTRLWPLYVVGSESGCVIMNVIYYPVRWEVPRHTRIHHLLDHFDMNACRVALSFDRCGDYSVIYHPYTIWDLATRTVSFNELSTPGLRTRPGARRYYWNPLRLEHRIQTYVAHYGYRLDSQSLDIYAGNVVDKMLKGIIVTGIQDQPEVISLFKASIERCKGITSTGTF